MINPAVLAVLAIGAIASPLDNGVLAKTTQPFCSHVASACHTLAQSKSAEKYCSSLFAITTVTVTPSCTQVSIPTSHLPSSSSSSRFASSSAAAAEAKILAQNAHKVPAPSYFTDVAPSAHFSSCDCFSFTTHTTKTTVATATQTGPFQIEASGKGYYSGKDTSFYDPDTIGFEYVNFEQKAPYGEPWVLNQDGYLVVEGQKFLAVQLDDPKGNTPVFVSDQPFNKTAHTPLLKCGIQQSTCALQCAVNGNFNDNYICYATEQWNINGEVGYSNCRPFTPIVVKTT